MTPIPKNPRFVDKAYLASFEHLPCLAAFQGGCTGSVVAAHFRPGWLASGSKPHDYLTVPLCYAHHTEHDNGPVAFWLRIFSAAPGSVLRDTIRDALAMRYYRRRQLLLPLPESGVWTPMPEGEE